MWHHPGNTPLSDASRMAGRERRTQLANHWKRWGAKPEAEVSKEFRKSFGVMLVRLQFGKPPETVGQQSQRLRDHLVLCSFGYRILCVRVCKERKVYDETIQGTVQALDGAVPVFRYVCGDAHHHGICHRYRRCYRRSGHPVCLRTGPGARTGT